MKIACNTFMFNNSNTSEVFDIISSRDFKGIGVFSGHFKEDFLNRLTIPIIGFYVVFINLTSQKSTDNSIKELKEVTNKFNKKALKNIILVIKEEEGKKRIEKLAAFMKTIGRSNEFEEINFYIEPLFGENKEFYFNDLYELIEFENIYSKMNVNYILDLFYIQNSNELIQILNIIKHKIYSVHLSGKIIGNQKAERVFIHQSDSETINYIRLLKENDYDGWLELEVINEKILEYSKEEIINLIDKDVKLIKEIT